MAVRKVAYTVAAAIIVLLLALPGSVSWRLKTPVREFFYPIQQAASRISYRIREAAELIRGLGGVISEKRRLEAEVAWLRLRLARLEQMAEENIRLRRLLAFSGESDLAMTPAEVIGRDASGWWRAVRINAGTRRGIHTNAPVITVDGLVGKVVEVTPHTAEVLLISDPAFRASAVIPQREAYGIMRGTGMTREWGQPCVMEFIQRDQQIAEGDRVETSGLGGVMPRGLLIGYVESQRLGNGGLYRIASVAPAADLNSLRYVMVVLARAAERADEGAGND